MAGYTYGATRRYDLEAVEADAALLERVREEAGRTRDLFDIAARDHGFREQLSRHVNTLDTAPASRVVSVTTPNERIRP